MGLPTTVAVSHALDHYGQRIESGDDVFVRRGIHRARIGQIVRLSSLGVDPFGRASDLFATVRVRFDDGRSASFRPTDVSRAVEPTTVFVPPAHALRRCGVVHHDQVACTRTAGHEGQHQTVDQGRRLSWGGGTMPVKLIYCGEPEPTDECEQTGYCRYHLGTLAHHEWEDLVDYHYGPAGGGVPVRTTVHA